MTRHRTQLLAAAAAGLVCGIAITVAIGAVGSPKHTDADGSQVPTPVVTVTVPAVPSTSFPSRSWSDTGTPQASAQPSEQRTTDQASSSAPSSDGKPEKAQPLAGVAPAGHGPLPATSPVTCPAATTTVASAAQLGTALADARPGDSIRLVDGTYSGNFAATVSGTAAAPIFLCGSAHAVIDGGSVDGDYAFHLDHASHWRLVGFTVSGGQKGVVGDGTTGSVIQGLTVTGTGDEAIHLREDSTANLVLGNTVSHTGQRSEKYGEGIYVGSAVSNWCTYTGCRADRSDRNVIKDNTISDTTAEDVDIKEGTTGGEVVGNHFDGAGMSGADSWVDVKGNNYLIADNTGVHAPQDGFQTHQILPGWGDFNVFEGNHADVGASGFGIASWPEVSNVVRCDNSVTGAGKGLSNIACS